MDEDSWTALGLLEQTSGRARIMQLDNGYPKLDLTQFDDMPQSIPLSNADLGLVRICLASVNLEADYGNIKTLGVEFMSPPQTAKYGRAEITICIDPDGALVELIQVHLEK